MMNIDNFDELLTENSTYQKPKLLKAKLIKVGLLKNVCSVCGLDPFWNGKILSLNPIFIPVICYGNITNVNIVVVTRVKLIMELKEYYK
jgi:hypothetical protein